MDGFRSKKNDDGSTSRYPINEKSRGSSSDASNPNNNDSDSIADYDGLKNSREEMVHGIPKSEARSNMANFIKERYVGFSSKDQEKTQKMLNGKDIDELSYEELQDLNQKTGSFESNSEKKLEEILEAETEKKVEELSDDDDAYIEYLDETGPSILDNYSASKILKESDPIMYREDLNNYVDGKVRDMERDIEKEAEDDVYDNLEDYGLTEDDYQEDPFYKAVEKRKSELTDEYIEKYTEETDEFDDLLDTSDASELNISSPGKTLQEIDPIAFRVGRADWVDGEHEHIYDQLKDDMDAEETLRSGEYTEL